MKKFGHLITITFVLCWASIADAVVVEVSDFAVVGAPFFVSTTSAQGSAYSHSADLSAPGSTTPAASASRPQGGIISFPLTYEQTGDYSYSINGIVNSAFRRDCSTDIFGNTTTCTDVVLTLDPAVTYNIDEDIVVVPELLANVDRLFAGQVGDLFPSGAPVDPALYGISLSSNNFQNPVYSFIANGNPSDRLPITFDAPGFYLIDWGGSTLDSFVKRSLETCGNIFFPDLCETFQLNEDLDAGLVSPYTTGFYVRELDVSEVPLPAAVWLFGTALIGLVGFSRRRKVS